ncbi:MAG: imidazolonepropionase, partial [Syntrophothermus sp.]
MRKLFTSLSQIVTVNTQGRNIKKGPDSGEVEVLENHSIVVENGKIADFIPSGSAVLADFDEVIELKGKVLLPGLIDCHTHTVFAGSRCDEFKMKIAGVDYEEIARQGGGIAKTMGAVRSISEAGLLGISRPRINYFISQGITSLEIKSGYGLSFDDEVKILNVISQLNREFPIDIVPTFLGAHTWPPEYKHDHKGYLDLICNKMLPYVAENRLAMFCDAFCESTAFQPDETEMILEKASSLGFMLKLHTEQFNRIGGLELGIKHKVKSLDHLEV